MEGILKKDVVSLTIFFGCRTFDNEEVYKIESNLPFHRAHHSCFYKYCNRNDTNFRDYFQQMEENLVKVLDSSDPMFIFIIISGEAAKEAKAWIEFLKSMRAKRENVFIYPVIFGDAYYSSMQKGGDKEYLLNSGNAARLYYDSDAPSAGADRVCEYASRLMGYDLDTEIFPAYDTETAIKMALHINLENFNYHTPKLGSVPKYPIRDGKPYFPILSVKVTCPTCGREKLISRFNLDEAGGVKTRCFGHENYHAGIAAMFDPWPEFEAKNK